MYKNRVKNDRIFLNEEIQNGIIQNNIYFLIFPTPFYAEFTHSQDKRAGISKKILSFSTLFLCIPCLKVLFRYLFLLFLKWQLEQIFLEQNVTVKLMFYDSKNVLRTSFTRVI